MKTLSPPWGRRKVELDVRDTGGRGAVQYPTVDLRGAGHLSVGLGARFVEVIPTPSIPTRRAPFIFDIDWPRYVVEVLW